MDLLYAVVATGLTLWLAFEIYSAGFKAGAATREGDMKPREVLYADHLVSKATPAKPCQECGGKKRRLTGFYQGDAYYEPCPSCAGKEGKP